MGGGILENTQDVVVSRSEPQTSARLDVEDEDVWSKGGPPCFWQNWVIGHGVMEGKTSLGRGQVKSCALTCS